MTENPYEAPQTYDDPLAPPRDAETVRRELISTETSLKTIEFYTTSAEAHY
jgi:hypothetical protein